jgi:nicotinamide mononucleotide (NMN) deamidase PncC
VHAESLEFIDAVVSRTIIRLSGGVPLPCGTAIAVAVSVTLGMPRTRAKNVGTTAVCVTLRAFADAWTP